MNAKGRAPGCLPLSHCGRSDPAERSRDHPAPGRHGGAPSPSANRTTTADAERRPGLQRRCGSSHRRRASGIPRVTMQASRSPARDAARVAAARRASELDPFVRADTACERTQAPSAAVGAQGSRGKASSSQVAATCTRPWRTVRAKPGPGPFGGHVHPPVALFPTRAVAPPSRLPACSRHRSPATSSRDCASCAFGRRSRELPPTSPSPPTSGACSRPVPSPICPAPVRSQSVDPAPSVRRLPPPLNT
jgi:hypothetical protein